MGPLTLAVIPARGGSKGVPHKNLRLLGGDPLVVHAISTAFAAGDLFHAVVVSTDDREIASISRSAGAEVPFIRPAELADDAAPTVPVIQHAVAFVESRDDVRFDWVMVLQPTEPFRRPEDLQASMNLARSGGCDSVISVVQVFATHPILMKKITDDRLVPYCIEEVEGTRRQEYDPPAYMRNGAIYLTARDVLMERNSLWGDTIRPYVMPEERSISIDSEIDLLVAQASIDRVTDP